MNAVVEGLPLLVKPSVGCGALGSMVGPYVLGNFRVVGGARTNRSHVRT